MSAPVESAPAPVVTEVVEDTPAAAVETVEDAPTAEAQPAPAELESMAQSEDEIKEENGDGGDDH